MIISVTACSGNTVAGLGLFSDRLILKFDNAILKIGWSRLKGNSLHEHRGNMRHSEHQLNSSLGSARD